MLDPGEPTCLESPSPTLPEKAKAAGDWGGPASRNREARGAWLVLRHKLGCLKE